MAFKGLFSALDAVLDLDFTALSTPERYPLEPIRPATATADGWTTRRRHNGAIQTIPPAHLDYGQSRLNHYHHPERLLLRERADDDPEDP